MKKKIILSILIVLIIAVVIALAAKFEKDDNNDINNDLVGKEISFYQGGNEAMKGLEPLNNDIVLGDILQEVKDNNVKELKGLTDTEINGLMELEWYNGLEKRVAKYESKDEYTEIWLIKLSNDSQALEFFRKFNESLRNDYKTESKLSTILNDEENIIMKKQDEVLVIIISNDAKEIEKSIDNVFLN